MEAQSSSHPSVHLLVDELPVLDRPLMLVAFGGAHGETAAATLGYLAHEWDAERIAVIEPEPYVNFIATRPIVRIENDERVIEWPETTIAVARPEGADRDVVLLVGPEPHLRWRDYGDAVRHVIDRLGVEEVVLVSSFTGATPHTRPTPVHLVGAAPEIAAHFAVPARRPRYQGPASYGMALVVMLREAGLFTGSLAAIAPFYVGIDPSPYALRSLVQTIDRALGSATDTADIDARIAEVDEHATAALERSEELRTFVANLEQQYDDAEQPALPAPANPLDSLSVDDLLADVESFLRVQQDIPGTGADGDGQPR